MTISLKSISPPLIVTYILGALLLIFTVAKASMTSLTYDEAFTFIYYLPQDFMRIFSFAAPYSANNHILSSLLMKVSQNLFGSSELALRIPSLLAHVVYICLTIAFLRKLSPLLLIPGFLLLNTNPYLLEFFALGRGYGLAICLMMGSLLMWIKYRETQKVRAYTLCLILAGAAAFSNFSLLLVVASILLLHNYEGLLSGKISTRSPIALLSSGLKHNKINLIFLVILVMVFYEPIRRCIKFKLLYHGGVTGFWPESIMTLLQFSLYDASYTTWLLNPLSWLLMAVLIISLGLLVNSIRVKVKENDSTPNWKMDFGLLFVLIISVCTVANWSFGNKYVIDRGALFLYPLLMLVLLTMINELFGFRGFKKIGFVLIIVFGLGSSAHLLNTQNLKDFIHWRHDSQTPVMMADLQKYSEGYSLDKPMYLGMEWIYYPVVNYHIIADEMTWVSLVSTTGIVGDEDMIYLSEGDTSKYVPLGFQVLKRYPITSTVLMKQASQSQ